MIATRGIPERTEELAWVLAALYGANQLGRPGQAFVEIQEQKVNSASRSPTGQ